MGKEKKVLWWKNKSSNLVQLKWYRPMYSCWKVPYEILFYYDGCHLKWYMFSPWFIHYSSWWNSYKKGMVPNPLGRTLFLNRLSMKHTRNNSPLFNACIFLFLLSFPWFFVHVIVLCKLTWIFFKVTKVKPIETWSSFVPYWHTLNITCPKQIPS